MKWCGIIIIIQLNYSSSLLCLWCLYEFVMIHSLKFLLFMVTQEASEEPFTQTLIPRGDSEAQACQVCMSLCCWGKPEYLETTDKDTGMLGIRPGTVLLQGYHATHFSLRACKHKLLKLKLPPLQLHLKPLFNYSPREPCRGTFS